MFSEAILKFLVLYKPHGIYYACDTLMCNDAILFDKKIYLKKKRKEFNEI